MSTQKKRKHTTSRVERDYGERYNDSKDTSHLYIQAYEANVVKGSQAEAFAKSLEFSDASESNTSLIQWKPEPSYDSHASPKTVWVDRYDARLLLQNLPSLDVSEPNNARLSPTGWSDLPSDAEDTFFFSPEEAEDYHREKRRRVIEKSREDRLKALRDEREEDPPEDAWGGSDEEPDDSQKELMIRTATHIVSSPNPAQLEMRILANHGADNRFAFLRGRWSRAWNTTKAKARLSLNKEKPQPQQSNMNGALGGLSGYGASDDDSDSEAEENTDPIPTPVVNNASEARDNKIIDEEEAIKEARRAKAREWAQKRRAQKERNETTNTP